MAGRKKPRKRGRGRPRPGILGRLKPEEAREVLLRLLEAHGELRAEAAEIATGLLAGASFESIADGVEAALLGLGLDDLASRAGRHSRGYLSPTDAAWELLEESVEPFASDMRRLEELGLAEQGLETRKGVVLGLYRVRNGCGDGVLEWAEDFPSEAASRVLEARGDGRGRRGRGPRLPRDFVARHAPEWGWLADEDGG
jgi:hypothetical protein